jgi:hypothetical protein
VIYLENASKYILILLEIVTERARKLRAQYNVQAQGLKTRIEIRVNRIPISMRKKNIGDLFDKHSNTGTQAARTELGPPVPPKNTHKKIPVEESESGPSTRFDASHRAPPSRATKRNRYVFFFFK